MNDDPVIILPVEPDPVITLPVEPDEPILEVAFYVYKKLDPELPASWPNSGVQDLIASVSSDEWFTEFPGVLPAYICGPGWGVQQDKVAHDGTFVWPEAIEYPHDNIGWPPIYAAQHSELGEFVVVPDCVTSVPVDPTPVVPPMLADTGPGDDLLSWLVVIASALILGGLVVAAFRRVRGDS